MTRPASRSTFRWWEIVGWERPSELNSQTHAASLLASRFTVNPVLIMVGVIFWYWMWGVCGAILATPMLAMTKIFCDRIERLKPIGHFIGG